MLYARVPVRALQLLAVLAATVSASTLPSNWLAERDGTCAANYNKCSQAGLPSSFCCPQGSSCNLLAGNTTVLCCPTGSDCSTIQIISCNISLQDPAKDPKAEIKTTVLNGKLPTCGPGCCPFGYHCDSNICVQDTDQSKKPGAAASSSPLPSSSVKPSSTSLVSSATTSLSSTLTVPTSSATGVVVSIVPTSPVADVTSTPAPTSSATAARNLNIAAIVGGVVGGLVLLSLIGVGTWLLRFKRKQALGGSKKRDSSSTFEKNAISNPIPHADYYAQRLDFLAKAQSSSVASSPTGTPAGLCERFTPSSPYASFNFRRDSEMIDRRTYHKSAEVGGLRNLTNQYSGGSGPGSSAGSTLEPETSGPEPVPKPPTPIITPPQGEDRQNSGGSESINIFADPAAMPVHTDSFYERRETTWTDLQHRADGHDPTPECPPHRHGPNLTVHRYL